jgi:hypothetical protein
MGADPVTSPIAHTPSAARIRSSTPIVRASSARPAAATPSPFSPVRGPVATSNCDAVISSAPAWTRARARHARNPAGLSQQVRGADHHLRRHARPVRALPTDQPRLDTSHVQPGLGQLPGGILAADT